MQLPPLRDRREDIFVLTDSFIKEFNSTLGKLVYEISNDALKKFIEYDWPGNVRELRNAIEFSIINSKEDKITLNDLPPEIVSYMPETLAHEAYDNEEERILAALERTSGNRSHAAKLLGIGRTTLYRKLSEISESKKQF